MEFKGLFKKAVEAGASDIHLHGGRRPVLRLNGSLVRVGTSPVASGELHAQITQMRPGITLVVVDLSRIAILPSIALGLLVQISNKCAARQQRLKLAGVRPQIRRVFSITRLDRVFQFADSVEAAME